MGMLDDLRRATDRLGDAALNPAEWAEALEGVCRAVKSTGAILLQPTVPTGGMPRTASVEEMFIQFDREGWHARDIRALKAIPRHLAGESVLIEEDILTPEEIRRSPMHNEVVFPNGLRWWAAATFRVGPALWGLTLHRTPQEGPFGDAIKQTLAQLGAGLGEAATLSRLIGHSALTGATSALNQIGQPALAISAAGLVLDANAAAERLLDRDVSLLNRRLRVTDRQAGAELERLLEQLRVAREGLAPPTAVIVVRRARRLPLLIRVQPVPPAARSPFLGACALLTLHDLDERPADNARLLVQVFGLTNAEARLALLVGVGKTIEHAAERLSISPLTARTQLKAIFAKTETHRQSELVALLSRLPSGRSK